MSSKKKGRVKSSWRERSPTTSMASDTDAMEVSDEQETQRGRGRPESTGDFRIRKAREAAEEIRREAAELRDVLDPAVPARPRGKGTALPEGLEDIRRSAVPTLRETIETELRVIEKVACGSRHLKGVFVKCLRDAAAKIATSAETLAERAEMGVSDQQGGHLGVPPSEVEKLRMELDSLRNENRRLREEVAAQGRRIDETLAARLSEAATITDAPRRRSGGPAAKPVAPSSSGSDGDWPPPGPSSPRPSPPRPAPRPVPPSPVKERRGEPAAPPVVPPGVGEGRGDRGMVPQTTAELTALIARVVSSVLDEREARQKNAPSVPPWKAPGKGGPKKGPSSGTPKAKGAPPPRNAPVPPRQGGGPSKKNEETWSRVVGRKEQRAARAPQAAPRRANGGNNNNNGGRGTKGGRATITKRRAPGSAAVTLTCPDGGYAEAMAEARANIRLADVGIASVRVRRAQTGALILEIPNSGVSGDRGDEEKTAAQKADLLAERMRRLFAGRNGIVVARPCKTADMRFRGMDDATTPGELAAAIARAGECDPAEVTVGVLNAAPDGLLSGWARCPVRAANKISAAKRLLVGWAAARAEMLPVRPLRCYQCMERGHTRLTCGSTIDRTGLCYRCGSPGHLARGCERPVKCPVCADAGKPSAHIIGSKACTAPVKRGVRVMASKTTASVAAPPSSSSSPPPPPPPPPVPVEASRDMEVDPPPLPQRRLRPRKRPVSDESGAESDATAVSRQSYDSASGSIAAGKKKRAAAQPPVVGDETGGPSCLGDDDGATSSHP